MTWFRFTLKHAGKLQNKNKSYELFDPYIHFQKKILLNTFQPKEDFQ